MHWIKKDLKTSVGQIQPQLQYSRPLLPIGNMWFFLHFCKMWNMLFQLHFTRLFRGQVHKRSSKQYHFFFLHCRCRFIKQPSVMKKYAWGCSTWLWQRDFGGCWLVGICHAITRHHKCNAVPGASFSGYWVCLLCQKIHIYGAACDANFDNLLVYKSWIMENMRGDSIVQEPCENKTLFIDNLPL